MKYQKKNELLLYAVIWLALFILPIANLYVRMLTDSDFSFEWNEVFHEWKSLGTFCIVFAIHNIFIVPLLVYRKKRKAYIFGLAGLLLAIVAWTAVVRPDNHGPNEPQRMERSIEDGDVPPPLPDGEPMQRQAENAPTPPPPRQLPPQHKKEPPLAGQQDVVAIIVMLLMLGLNVYVKYYFRLADERKRLKDIEKQNLEHQLEYLKYQINPHFFMNTLNNIHALVDIDPELAKTTIVELSKLMRFVLYEGSKPSVPLQREIAFVSNYIRLMRIRYADKVKIDITVEEPVPKNDVPPLITIAFVENAFKHGISYKNASFVDVRYTFAEGKMNFTCRNSNNDVKSGEAGGVGLENVRRRLNLIYGDRHSLVIRDQNDIYEVELSVPLE